MSVHMINLLYLASAVLFMLGIKGLSSPATAKNGNKLSMVGMGTAIFATLVLIDFGVTNFSMIYFAIIIGGVIGGVAATRVEMTSMPEMVALFNGCGGAASALVALAEFHGSPDLAAGSITLFPLMLSVIIGGLTFTGSLVAYGKLQGLISSQPILYKGQQLVNGLVLACVAVLAIVVWKSASLPVFYLVMMLALGLGILAVIPIGGADMPVVISLLNSYSGIAVSMTGFAINNNALIIVGSLVGASGLFLTRIMCEAMNRSLANVLFSGFGQVVESTGDDDGKPAGTMKGYEIEDVMMVLDAADSLIIVPGYGMAAAQAQHVVRELADKLSDVGVKVRYAVHSVAGRMPGHMNVLLAEADVDYDQLYAMEEINDDFSETDVVLVIGANDVVNPAAKTNPKSPIYGMPVLDVEKAKNVVVLKRSMNVGFAGIENELFYLDNTMMLFGDAKKSVQHLVAAMDE